MMHSSNTAFPSSDESRVEPQESRFIMSVRDQSTPQGPHENKTEWNQGDHPHSSSPSGRTRYAAADLWMEQLPQTAGMPVIDGR
ncbi:hypothetical protein NHX12_022540 [Muraenolepis orangiensis]|uniref:Uncharacterized protein n=1 Tax=Muraenolepis orangiensis TaxID=630683 RepID=A0A9Q0EQD5_9TELE|nr:hypothetical protein NHX12_022540 [Muraenolepis orangiensis]